MIGAALSAEFSDKFAFTPKEKPLVRNLENIKGFKLE